MNITKTAIENKHPKEIIKKLIKPSKKDGKICFVGEKYTGTAAKEINCEGRLVTPGWVDIHTHFDGQITWDPMLSPMSQNGVIFRIRSARTKARSE